MFDVLKDGHHIVNVWRGRGCEPTANIVVDGRHMVLAGWENYVEIASWACTACDVDPYECEFCMSGTGEIMTMDELFTECFINDLLDY